MSALRGVIVGTLALSALEAVVSSSQAVHNTNALVTLATATIRRLVDPTVPLIPDLRH